MITPFENKKNKSFFESEEGFLWSQYSFGSSVAYITFHINSHLIQKKKRFPKFSDKHMRVATTLKKLNIGEREREKERLAGISEDKRRGEESLKAISQVEVSAKISNSRASLVKRNLLHLIMRNMNGVLTLIFSSTLWSRKLIKLAFLFCCNSFPILISSFQLTRDRESLRFVCKVFHLM